MPAPPYNPKKNATPKQDPLAAVEDEAKKLLAQGTGDQDPLAVAFGKYAGVPIPGALRLLGAPLTALTPPSRKVAGRRQGWPIAYGEQPADDYSAQETLDKFKGMTGPKLANIQMLLYRAGGFYSVGSSPLSHLGILIADDIQAFQMALLGFAVNPTQRDAQDNKIGLDGYLDQLAQGGDRTGVNLRNKAPNVIHLTNPDELRTILQKGAQELYGGRLPDEDVNKFVQAYQFQESATKTAAYNAGEGNLGTYGGSASVTDPASVSTAAETFIRTEHPNQVAATEFGSAMDNMLTALRRPG